MKSLLILLLLPVSAFAAVDFHVAENHKASNTDKYRSDGTLLVRRGAPFGFGADGDTAELAVEARYGGGVKRWRCPTARAASGEWRSALPSDLPAGNVTLQVTGAGGKLLASTPAIVLFNPYAEDTPESMNGHDLGENVENEAGRIWVGDAQDPFWTPWSYDQFDMSVLAAALSAIDGLTLEQRAEPVLVARALTYYANEVIEGRWDGNYKDGKNPWSWTGSREVLAAYQKTKTRVKYGQCWVFAGVTNSLTRTLGIPSRVVTNFDSAHEHRGGTVEVQWKKDGDRYVPVSDEKSGTIWNFHVWSEAWIARPDLGDTTSWNIIDGTWHAGPASLRRLRAGDAESQYDSAFIGGEVNAQLRLMADDGTGPRPIAVQAVANRVLAGDTPLADADITEQYRLRVAPCLLQGGGTNIDVGVTPPHAFAGPGSSTGNVSVLNHSKEKRTLVMFTVGAWSDATGHFDLWDGGSEERVTLAPGAGAGVPVTFAVPPRKSPETAAIELLTSVHVIETGEVFLHRERVPAAGRVKLTFGKLAVETGYDFVAVYDNPFAEPAQAFDVQVATDGVVLASPDKLTVGLEQGQLVVRGKGRAPREGVTGIRIIVQSPRSGLVYGSEGARVTSMRR